MIQRAEYILNRTACSAAYDFELPMISNYIFGAAVIFTAALSASCSTKSDYELVYDAFRVEAVGTDRKLVSLYGVRVNTDGSTTKVTSISKLSGDEHALLEVQTISREESERASFSVLTTQGGEANKYGALLAKGAVNYANGMSTVFENVFPGEIAVNIEIVSVPSNAKVDEHFESVLNNGELTVRFFAARTDDDVWEQNALRAPVSVAHEVHHIMIRLPQYTEHYTRDNQSPKAFNFVIDEVAAEVFSGCLEFAWRDKAQVWARPWIRVKNRQGSATDQQLLNALNDAAYQESSFNLVELHRLSSLIYGTVWLSYFGNTWEVASDDKKARDFQYDFCDSGVLSSRSAFVEALTKIAKDGKEAPEFDPKSASILPR